MRWSDLSAGLEAASVAVQAATLFDERERESRACPAQEMSGKMRQLYKRWLNKARGTKAARCAACCAWARGAQCVRGRAR